MLTSTSYEAAIFTPVGQTAIFCTPEFAHTVTRVKHINYNYWRVSTVLTRDAFRSGDEHGQPAVNIWFDNVTQRWVIDYLKAGVAIEVATCRGLGAALGLATFHTGQCGHNQGLW
jgi:hypothetical protein